MAQPSALEQFMLELINVERVKAGVQPLASDGQLNDAADQHSQWMIETDTFSHTGAAGSTPTERMADTGVDFSGNWASGENIGWTSTDGSAEYQDEVQELHTNLMNSEGHRENILNPEFREVGIGFATGTYQGGESAFVTEDFARTGTDAFLTGVAFSDTDGDKLYDPGEGLGGISVKAVGAGGEIHTTTTFDSGGYDLALPAGSYEVTFSGPGIAESTREVAVAASNIKLDLVNPASNEAPTDEISASTPGSDAAVTAGLEEVATTLPVSGEEQTGAPAQGLESPQLPVQDASSPDDADTVTTTDALIAAAGQPQAASGSETIDHVSAPSTPAADHSAEGIAPQSSGDTGTDGEATSQDGSDAGPSWPADQVPPVAGSTHWDDIVQEFLAADATGSTADDNAGDDQHAPWWEGVDAFDDQFGFFETGADDRPDAPSFAEGLGVAELLDELEACVTAHTEGAHHAIAEAVSSFLTDLHAKLGAAHDHAV